MDNKPKKIRCKKCGHIIAYELKPIDNGEISILCNARTSAGERCKTINVIKANSPKN